MNRALMDRVSWNSKTSILVYFKHDIITKLLKTKNVSVGTEAIFIEMKTLEVRNGYYASIITQINSY